MSARAARTNRILVATFGSAGDLLPLVPAAIRLRAAGHDVRFAVPRPLGLYLRAWRLPVFALGTGAELRVLDDERLVTTRFGGWASWRDTVCRYVLPPLPDDVALLDRVIGDWRPDVVVSSGFSVAARIAAALHALPRLELSIYPQHWLHLHDGSSFGRPLRAAVARLCGRASPLDRAAVAAAAWGPGSDGLLLHDEWLLGADGSPSVERLPPVVGFPYWDGPHGYAGDAARVEGWLGRSRGTVVMVTLGSFLGARQRQTWLQVAKAVEGLGVRAVFVEPTGRWREPELQGRSDVLTVGFVPLSLVAHRFDAVVHHGGIGTTFGVLRSGRPALVVPQAFDQPFNAALVAGRGAGADASDSGVGVGLERVLGDVDLRRQAREAAGALVPAERAAERVTAEILDRAGR